MKPEVRRHLWDRAPNASPQDRFQPLEKKLRKNRKARSHSEVNE